MTVETIVAEQTPPPRPERRAWVRYDCNQDASCQPVPQKKTDECWRARILDVAAAGIRLLLPCRIEPGTTLVVELPTPQHLFTKRQLRVVRVTAERKGRWSVGCAFDRNLSDDELNGLL